MASERQIAANRRNAQKSTGPRSAAGKRRASRNAYRHGLAAGTGHAQTGAVEIEALASEIAAAATGSVVAALDLEILGHARTAAQAKLDLARIRGIKAVTMRSLMAVADAQIIVPAHGNEAGRSGDPVPALSPGCAMPVLPALEPQPQTEAMQYLTALLKLDRYEQRATARRDRAVLNIVARRVLMTIIETCNWRNGPNRISSIARSVL